MSIPKMANAMGYIDDDLIIGAVEYKRTKKKDSLLKLGALAASLCLILAGAFMTVNLSGIQNEEPYVQNPATENNDQTISLDGITGNGRVDLFYDKGYTSVKELLDVTALIVRATPIAIERESGVAVCWVLRVTEADKEGVEVIRLRQMKDEYLLEVGQEVVLALQQDAGEGYYNIPGGGCGLFRIDEETKAISGPLLAALKEQAASICSPGELEELTLEDIFDILIELNHQ